MGPAASPNAVSASGLRAVRYENADELLTDAEATARVKVTTLRRWSRGHIDDHIAQASHHLDRRQRFG